MMKEATSTKVTNTTPRKVYRRNGITHICFEGQHFAPETGESAFSLKHPVTRVTVVGATILEVAQSVNRKKAAVETWVAVEVPRKHRAPKADTTTEEFQKASAAGLKKAA
jgi:hypothetical protein